MGRGSHGHGHSHHGHSHGDDHDDNHHHSPDTNTKKKLSNQTNGHGHSHGGGGHGHSHGGGGDSHSKFCGCCFLSNRVRISSMLGMTFFFFLVELISGQVTKSIALTTDSFHMLSDSLALVIGLFSIIV
jgi:cobalt-zinc-cadmium efflux system protein